MAQITDYTKVIRIVSNERGPLLYAPSASATTISSGLYSNANVATGASRINPADVNFISNSKIEIDHNAQITDAVNGNATQGQNQNPIWGE